ncbi:rhodanese-like domain-containing protein [Mesoterricola silvestris]|uniref:Rhodanese domain-containing protein n=1 Tax=Mesoterricola silvestris TaxID=2927979 RepID=A0AA48KDF7_9BACT|nr:rhodanese-like domain-containing protein [Mesoterricola silvestris]BDU74423.1 hypothetical protein METEAL_35970 [Mesoterricola silvestris]
MNRYAQFSLRALAFVAAAGLLGTAANRFAPPRRKLDWLGQAPVEPLPPVDPPGAAPAAELEATPSARLTDDRAARPETARAARPETARAVRPEAARAAGPAPRAADPLLPSATQAVRQITSQEASLAFAKHVLFLDARRSAEFEDGHVQGAWSAPVWEVDCDRRITEFEARANPGMKDPIVVYCSSGCEDSRLLAAKLQALGYRNLLVYTDGFPDWTAKGRPVARGPRP